MSDTVRLVTSHAVENNSFILNSHNVKRSRYNTIKDNTTEPKYCQCECECKRIGFCGSHLCKATGSGPRIANSSGAAPSVNMMGAFLVHHMQGVEHADATIAILKRGQTAESYYDSIALDVDIEMESRSVKPEFLTLNSCLQELRRLILNLHAIGHKNFRSVIDEFRAGKYDEHYIVISKQYTKQQVEMLKAVSHRVSYKQFACLDCLRTKLKAHPRKKVSTRPTLSSPMASGHVDVFGPFLVPLHGRKRYVYVYICDDSTYMLDEWSTYHDTDQAGAAVQAWRCLANGAGWSMHKQHFDADAVFKAKDFEETLNSMDIGTEYAPPGQHWVNGLIERFGQTVTNNAMAMLNASGLPAKYYPFAFSYSIFLHNHLYRIPKTVGRNPEYWGKTPNEIVGLPYKGPTPGFGQAVMARHSNPDILGKLDDVGRLCAFLNIDRKSHDAMIMLHIKTGVVITGADIHILPNIYAWTMKPIVREGNLHVMGRDIDLPRDSATTPQATQEIREAFGPEPPPITAAKRHRLVLDPEKGNANEQSIAYRTRSLVPPTDLPQYPDNIMAGCAQAVTTYYAKADEATNNAVKIVQTSTPNIQKAKGVVVNNQVTSRYFQVNYCNIPELLNCQYERGLSMEEADQVILDARNNAANFLECEAYAIQPSGRHRSKLIDFGDGPTLVQIPSTLKKALEEGPAAPSSPSSPSMHEIFFPAWQKEIASFVKRGSLGPPVSVLPEGMVPVKMKFAFDIKTSASQHYLKGKVRLVSKGFMTRYMVHYRETYSPTAHIESTRFVIYLIVACNFTEFSIDIEVAYLNDPAITRVFYEDMPGLPGYDPNKMQWREGLTNIYGNKDAGRIFWRKFVPRLMEAGYQPTQSDPCLLWKRSATDQLSIIAIHVDNVTGASEDPNECAQLKESLQKHYTVTFENKIDKILGMTLHRNSNGNAVVFSDGYFNDAAEQLGLTNLKPARTMGDPSIRFQPNTIGKATEAMITLFRHLIGSMIFPGRMWRLDMYNRVRDLAAFNSNPSFEHIEAAIRILRRGMTTNRYGLVFAKPKLPVPKPLKFELVGWSDADWSKEFDWKSVSGTVMRICFPEEVQYAVKTKDYSQLVYNCIAYQSKKQSDHVADSSMMSETVAGCVMMRGMMWARGLLEEMQLLAENSKGIMFNDNKGLIVNLHNFRITTKMRHYGRSIAFLIHEVENGRISPIWIPAIKNLANQLTKNLPQTEMDQQSQWLMAYAEWST